MDICNMICMKTVRSYLFGRKNRSGLKLKISSLEILLCIVIVIGCSCGNSDDGSEAAMRAGAEMADEVVANLSRHCHERMIQIYNDAVRYHDLHGTFEGFTYFPTYCPVNNDDNIIVQFDSSNLYVRCSNPQHGEIVNGETSW